jgi:uncharacterized HAD superfamily protein
MKYVIDIDGTICSQEPNYADAKPYKDRIRNINALHSLGHQIVFFTARGTETKIDWRNLTEKQLCEWGVYYDELIFGKPSCDLFIDDRAQPDSWLGAKGV